MKIVEKISLQRGFMRLLEPNHSYPKLSRTKYYRDAPYRLTPSEQLHKYSSKPAYFQLRWALFSLAGGLAAVFWKIYENQMYTNELDTIYRYRYHEEEVPSVKLYTRLYVLKAFLWMESRLWVSALFKKKTMGSETYEYQTQCMIRYNQYEHYVKNKDAKYDFLDLGVLQKFPYPKKTVEPGLE